MVTKSDWIIAIDTREQCPLKFPDWPYQIVTLATGDYSILGFEDRVAVERKSLTDWIHSVIHDQKRFKRELERLQSFPFKCIVIESDLRELFAQRYWSQASPISIVGLTMSLMIDYQIPILFCSTREIAAKVVLSFLKRAFKRLTKKDE